MYKPKIRNFIYFQNKSEKGKPENYELSKKDQEEIFELLGKQSMKERTPNLEELETIIQNKINPNLKSEDQMNSNKIDADDDSISITRLLREKGYLKENDKWLTKKGFFAIGKKILNDVMRNLKQSDFGFHETTFSGDGNVVIDSTRKFEPGNDIKYLSAHQTLLNSIQRLSNENKSIKFPLSLSPDDLEQHETLDDVKTAIVYCIDLSSTMKSQIGENGSSRLEAAKKALWGLYILNKKFFPNDTIFVVGFASMASEVNPIDIPFLKTFDANDNFLHYTNYQAALRLARKILNKVSYQNKRIVLITDGQPSACFVENEYQKQVIISDKPYSNFYSPDSSVLSKIKAEKNMNLDSPPERLVYLCYRYKKVDPKINERTILEAKKCQREGIQIDSIVISDEMELLEYVQKLEMELKGRTYHIKNENMDSVLISDYVYNTRKVITSQQGW